MTARVGVFFCSCIILGGCGIARDAAVTSYHVAAAPVKLTRWMITDPPRPEKAHSADATVSDHTVTVASPSPTSISRRSVGTSTASLKPKVSSSPTRALAQTEFPVAKAVPGKPGYVFSPYESDKYVDVSGYTSGSKVKDPYAQKIFIVP